MEPTPENLTTLSQCFLQSLAADPEPRKKAEAFLRSASSQAGFGITVLTLVATASVDEQVKQAAAVNFKNFVKFHWSPKDSDQVAHTPIQDAEKEKIKEHIVNVMLASALKVQAQISEALSIISSHDFPAHWPTLLPELVSRLSSSSDYSLLLGVLQTANSIFKRFRHQFKSEQLFKELKQCLDSFVAPSLALFLATGQQVAACQAGIVSDPSQVERLRLLLQCQRLQCRVFFSLNSQDLPEVYEDHLAEWMGEFLNYLALDDGAMREKDMEKESVVDQLKAAICENVNLYMEKYEDEFKDFLPSFVTAVWTLLMQLPLSAYGLAPGRDPLAIGAMAFLTTVSRSVHHGLFAQEGVLGRVCESIVVPNVRLREEEEELFEMNYTEYIRRDIEGSDSDTRRRMACELVKGLSTHYQPQVTQLLSTYVAAELAQYAANPDANWKSKDTATFLVVALAVVQKTATAGATKTNELVNLPDFFQGHILPELQAADINSRPIIKADCLKFLITFRSQLPASACRDLLPRLVALVGSEANVVHSYAAMAVERMLVTKDAGVPRFSGADVAGFAEPLLGALFAALKMPESQENQYVMKCIMRVISTTAAASIPAITPACLQHLVDCLASVIRNPSNPTFNHYLFEALAALLRRATSADTGQVAACEGALFPLMQAVLEQDVQEFAPYVFQLLALLLETRPLPLPPVYMAVFPALIAPALWERPANVPALVRLLQAYLQRASEPICTEGRLPGVLGVFQKQIASKHSDHHGFFILNTVVERLDLNTLAPFLPHIWGLLFLRLQNSRTPKYVRGLLVFLSLFAVKHGVSPLAASINGVQPGLLLQLLASTWAPNLPSVTGAVETKLCAVAGTDMLSQYTDLQADAHLAVWGSLLDGILSLLVRPEEERAAEEADVAEAEEVTGGYAASYAQLHHAGKQDDDPVKDKTNDARQYLTAVLSSLCSQRPGKFSAVFQKSLQPANQQALADFASSYHLNLL